MIDAVRPIRTDDEEGRLAALHRYDVLDTPPQPEFDLITGMVSQLLNVPMCAVSLIDRDRQSFKSTLGLDHSDTSRASAFCDYTIGSAELLDVPDALADPRFATNPHVTGSPRIRSYIGAPLTTPEGYNVGALCAIDNRPRDFTAEQRLLLRQFSRLVVEQLELRTAAHEDFLTGAVSRRAFTDRLTRLHERWRRDAWPATLVMFDIDHFKRVNDGFGHPTGDRVLQMVVEAVRTLLRPDDFVGRLGGEEFGVVLGGVGIRDACVCAERMRVAIATLVAEDCPQVTASFGLAPLKSSRGVDDWIAAADRALYAAKSAGRDQCIVEGLETLAA